MHLDSILNNPLLTIHAVIRAKPHTAVHTLIIYISLRVFLFDCTSSSTSKKQSKNPSTTVRYGTQGTNGFKAFKADSQCSPNMFVLLKSSLISQQTIRLSALLINNTVPTGEHTLKLLQNDSRNFGMDYSNALIMWPSVGNI